MVIIRTPPNQRIIVNWNVQAFADACSAATGATNFGTYIGHSPSAERATDIFTVIPMPRSIRVQGDDVADFTLRPEIWKTYGVRYIIWRQRINWNDGEGWRPMEDRGDDNQNHFNHGHVSFNVIPKRGAIESPVGGIDMLIVNVKDTGIYLLRGNKSQHFTHPDHVLQWVKAGVPYQDKMEISSAVFEQYGTDGSIDVVTVPVPYDEMIAAVQAGIQDIYDQYVRDLQVPQ